MQDKTRVIRQLNKWGTTLIHLKSQVLTHTLFGIPLAMLLAAYLGLPKEVIWKLFVFMVANVGFWALFWVFYGHLAVRSVRGALKEFLENKSLQRETVIRTIEFFLNCPHRTAFHVFLVALSAYGFGAVMLRMGLVPGVASIKNVVSVVTIFFGLVAAFVESLFNYTFLESYLRQAVELFVRLHPGLRGQLHFRKVSLFNKVFILVFCVAVVMQIALLTIFLGRIAVLHPSEFLPSFAYLVSFMLLASVYVFIIVKIFTSNIAEPLQKLIDWSRDVIKGNLEEKTYVVTNDEITDVISYSEKMVDELKREHNLIAAEKNKLTVVLSGIADGVMALDRSCEVVVFNKAAEEITGWKRGEVVGKHVDDVFYIYDQSGERVASDDFCPHPIRADEDKIVYLKTNLRLEAKEGDEKYVDLMAVSIKEGEMAEVVYIVTFHDVTDERELERMKLDFVAMAAHELRTPLTSIMGYLSVLQEEAGPNLSPEHQQFISRSLTSGRRLTALMENLLSITRIEKGKVSLQLQAVDWERLVEEKVEEFKPMADEEGLKVEWISPKQPLPRVKADPLRIMEVLSNLLNNAVMYTKKGSVTVWCEYDEGGREVITHIKDTGPGIPKESLPHLFEKFYRIAGPLEEGSKGTGLGLYISKSIVTMHDGRIWVESELGKGSTFSFSLPAVVA